MRSILFLVASAFIPFAGFTCECDNANDNEWLLDYTTTIPDFPIPGIQFKWFGPLMRDPAAFDHAIKTLADRYRDQGINVIAGLEARGFILGAALARELGVSFAPVRKAGKLPGKVVTASYTKEYGKDSFEMEIDAVNKGDRVLIIDDLVATGGTAQAACHLVEQVGATVVELACLYELTYLKAREKLPCPLYSMIKVDQE